MVEGLLDATMELLNKALTNKQKELVIEPARASLAKESTYAAIAAEKVRKCAICVLPQDSETTDKGGAQGPVRLEGRHEVGGGHILRRKTGMRDIDNASIRAYPDKKDRV